MRSEKKSEKIFFSSSASSSSSNQNTSHFFSSNFFCGPSNKCLINNNNNGNNNNVGFFSRSFTLSKFLLNNHFGGVSNIGGIKNFEDLPEYAKKINKLAAEGRFEEVLADFEDMKKYRPSELTNDKWEALIACSMGLGQHFEATKLYKEARKLGYLEGIEYQDLDIPEAELDALHKLGGPDGINKYFTEMINSSAELKKNIVSDGDFVENFRKSFDKSQFPTDKSQLEQQIQKFEDVLQTSNPDQLLSIFNNALQDEKTIPENFRGYMSEMAPQVFSTLANMPSQDKKKIASEIARMASQIHKNPAESAQAAQADHQYRLNQMEKEKKHYDSLSNQDKQQYVENIDENTKENLEHAKQLIPVLLKFHSIPQNKLLESMQSEDDSNLWRERWQFVTNLSDQYWVSRSNAPNLSRKRIVGFLSHYHSNDVSQNFVQSIQSQISSLFNNDWFLSHLFMRK